MNNNLKEIKNSKEYRKFGIINNHYFEDENGLIQGQWITYLNNKIHYHSFRKNGLKEGETLFYEVAGTIKEG